MPTTIKNFVNEQGSCKVTAVFRDENDTLFTPKTLFKQLTDLSGNVVSARVEVTSGLASTMYFYLTGDDLAVPADGKGYVVFTLDGTYDSAGANDLDFTDECRIPIADLVAIE